MRVDRCMVGAMHRSGHPSHNNVTLGGPMGRPGINSSDPPLQTTWRYTSSGP